MLPDLKQQLATATGIFRGKERKDIAGQIQRTEQEISHRLDVLPTIVQAEGYPDVQAFTATYRKAEAVVSRYNRELAEWEPTGTKGAGAPTARQNGTASGNKKRPGTAAAVAGRG